MRSRCTSPLAILVVLAIGFTTLGVVIHLRSFNSPTELAVMPPGDVPAAIRAHVETIPGTTDSIWRACYEQDGYTVAVRTYDLTDLVPHDPRAKSRIEILLYRDVGSEMVYVAHYASQAYEMEDYLWKPGEAGSEQVEWQDRTHYAIGWAFADEATSVVGTTTLGRQFESPVVDGFWFLRVADHVGPEIFDSAVVKASEGNVIHEYPARVYRP